MIHTGSRAMPCRYWSRVMPSNLEMSDLMLSDSKKGLTDEQRQLRRKAIAALSRRGL